MKFTCGDCDALCCRQPLKLYTKSEFKKAKRLKANIKYVELRKGAYLPIIDIVDGVCQFLKNGKCSIYNDRFVICKGYFCSMLRKDKTELDSIEKILDEFNNGKCTLPQENPLIFFEKDIKKYKYPIISLEEHMDNNKVGIEKYKENLMKGES